jgi:hypothetical protein
LDKYLNVHFTSPFTALHIKKVAGYRIRSFRIRSSDPAKERKSSAVHHIPQYLKAPGSIIEYNDGATAKNTTRSPIALKIPIFSEILCRNTATATMGPTTNCKKSVTTTHD